MSVRRSSLVLVAGDQGPSPARALELASVRPALLGVLERWRVPGLSSRSPGGPARPARGNTSSTTSTGGPPPATSATLRQPRIKKCGRGHRGEKGFLGGVATKVGGSFGACIGWGVGVCASVGFNMKDGFSYSHGGTGIHQGRGLFGLSLGPALTYQSHAMGSRGYCAQIGPLGGCKDRSGRRQYQVGMFSRDTSLMSWGVVSSHAWSKRWWGD